MLGDWLSGLRQWTDKESRQWSLTVQGIIRVLRITRSADEDNTLIYVTDTSQWTLAH